MLEVSVLQIVNLTIVSILLGMMIGYLLTNKK